jgi:hypothetical protein
MRNAYPLSGRSTRSSLPRVGSNVGIDSIDIQSGVSQRHGVLDAAQLEDGVHPQTAVHVEREVLHYGLLEPILLEGGVLARVQKRRQIVARAVRQSLERDAGIEVGDRYADARHDCAGTVFYNSFNRSGKCLRCARCR